MKPYLFVNVSMVTVMVERVYRTCVPSFSNVPPLPARTRAWILENLKNLRSGARRERRHVREGGHAGPIHGFHHHGHHDTIHEEVGLHVDELGRRHSRRRWMRQKTDGSGPADPATARPFD